MPAPGPDNEHFQARGVREGRRAREIAKMALERAGFRIVAENQRRQGGVELNFVALDQAGTEWLFDVSGAFTSARAGLQRTDTLWKALGKATVVHYTHEGARYVLLTTDAPAPNSAGGKALRNVTGPGKPVYAVLSLRVLADLELLEDYGRGRS